jgi:hypothetical protein
MFDLGNGLFTLIPHFVFEGERGTHDEICARWTDCGLIALGCISGAFAFGVIANAAIDLVMPPERTGTIPKVVAAEPAAPARGFALASATSAPVDLAPVKVKTVPMIFREDALAEAAAPAADPIAEETRPVAQVPLPRRRPASAPSGAMAMAPSSDDSIAGQPGSIAITAATRRAQQPAYDGNPLGSAGIERMKIALALTAEQEEFWPAVATELQAIGKTVALHKNKTGKINVDNETMQRLYWAAAPLISRLSFEQKSKVKEMARLMGLNEVAAAL